jgi:hypothetical protein
MLKQALICGVMVIGLGGGMPPQAAFAQTDQAQSLADIRQELSVLYFEIQRSGLSSQQRAGQACPQERRTRFRGLMPLRRNCAV